MVHITLEKLYLDLQSEQLNTLDDLFLYFIGIWNEKYHDEILILRKQHSIEHYQSLGKRYIKNYYQSYQPFNQTKTISIEDHVIFNLDDEEQYKIQGFIDRLSEKDPGHYQIHDYKTGSRLPSQNQLDNDRQLGLYYLGVTHKYPLVKKITLLWHYLKFNKELKSKRTEKQLEELKNQVIMLINKIESSSHYPCKPSFLCNWCEYKPICPQHSPLFQVRENKLNSYRKRNGQQLVDQYFSNKNNGIHKK
jgi:putative RecB family exonuclease